jgi:probable phosphoglycerate mutase
LIYLRHREEPIRDGRAVKATVVLLVRHGQTATTGTVLPGRAPGLHLAVQGRREAEALAARIGQLKRVAAVYSSPLERARETASAIALARRLAVRLEPGLTECDVGRWTGVRLKELRRMPEWRVVQRYASGFRFPGGESFTEMQARVTSAVSQLVARHPGETIVAVSHADPIKAAVAHALGIHLDFLQRIVISPGSVTAIAYGPAGPAVLTVNSRVAEPGIAVAS